MKRKPDSVKRQQRRKKPELSDSESMDHMVLITQALFTDIAVHHKVNLRYESDFLDRVRDRGPRFLTVELPKLGKALDSALTSGRFVMPDCAVRMRGLFPRFLHKLFLEVFHEDGTLRKDASISGVRDLRQVFFLWYKYELPHDEETVMEAYCNFLAVDAALPDVPTTVWHRRITDMARILLSELLCDLDPSTLVPSHGNGAVKEGIDQPSKSGHLMTDPRYDVLLPRYAVKYATQDVGRTKFRTIQEYRATLKEGTADEISKLADVPKDSRGPRLICIEPVTQQFMQQGLKDLLYKHIERHPLTRGHVNFTDQKINQKLALLGSRIERDVVTLDMKEASDRVTDSLVHAIFPKRWVAALDAVRSTHVDINGFTVRLKKHAPMGSAVCFPVEALCFWALGVSTLVVLNGVDVNVALKGFYVYGDDIILRGLPYKTIYKVFPHYGLRFNESKCCVEGRFRESCGTDAFNGEEVTPLKIKKLMPSKLSDIHLVSWCSYADNAFSLGNWHMARAIECALHKAIGQELPFVTEDSPAIGYVSKGEWCETNLYCLNTQKPLFMGLRIRTKRIRRKDDRSRYHDTIMMLARRTSAVTSTETVPTKSRTAYCAPALVYGLVSPYTA